MESLTYSKSVRRIELIWLPRARRNTKISPIHRVGLQVFQMTKRSSDAGLCQSYEGLRPQLFGETGIVSL